MDTTEEVIEAEAEAEPLIDEVTLAEADTALEEALADAEAMAMAAVPPPMVE